MSDVSFLKPGHWTALTKWLTTVDNALNRWDSVHRDVKRVTGANEQWLSNS